MEVTIIIIVCVLSIVHAKNIITQKQHVDPCVAVPSRDTLELLFCTGWDVTVFPSLDENQRETVRRIYITDTLIVRLPTMATVTYPNLTSFEEVNNIAISCADILNWMYNQPDTEFLTDCQYSSTSSTTSTSKSEPTTMTTMPNNNFTNHSTSLTTADYLTSTHYVSSSSTVNTTNTQVSSSSTVNTSNTQETTMSPNPTNEIQSCEMSCQQMIAICSTMFMVTLAINIFSSIYYGLKLRNISKILMNTTVERQRGLPYMQHFSNPNYSTADTAPRVNPTPAQASSSGPIYVEPSEMISHTQHKHVLPKKSRRPEGGKSKHPRRQSDVTIEMSPMTSRDATQPAHMSKEVGGAKPKTPEGSL